MNTTIVSPWTDATRERWQRIALHAFEDANAPLDFCAKLAREQGWTRAEALAAIEEYRRFCFLATLFEGDVVPSVAVDEVWHQHLTYSQDYWDGFCPRVLGLALHHQPGGLRRGDSARYRTRYAETLAEYERWFGAPSAYWWPGTAERFATSDRFRRVDREQVWIIRKPRLLQRARTRYRAAGAVLAGLLASSFVQAMPLNPLDWQGPTFLLLFAGLCVASVIVAFYLRIARSDSGRGGSTHGLDASSIAYLAGGEARVVDRVVGELLARHVAEFNQVTGVLHVNDVPRDLDAPADEIATALRRDGHLGHLQGRFASTMQGIRKTLESRGLLLDAEAAGTAARAAAMAPALVLAFGVMKIVIGISRDRPVALLVILCVMLAAVTLAFALIKPKVSRAGQRALVELKLRNARAMRAPKDNEWPIALALVGTTVMTGTAFAAFHDYRQPPSSSSSGDSNSSSSSDSSSSGDSGGDSGGSSGCGGCGGGGGD